MEALTQLSAFFKNFYFPFPTKQQVKTCTPYKRQFGLNNDKVFIIALKVEFCALRERKSENGNFTHLPNCPLFSKNW